jgi:hypothetical protein
LLKNLILPKDEYFIYNFYLFFEQYYFDTN